MYIGIDFSSTSTAICDENLNFYCFPSNIKEKDLIILREYGINVHPLQYKTKSEDYIENENIKLHNLSLLVDSIYNIVPENSTIGIEGFAYSSFGSSGIDLAGWQYTLRYRLYNSEKNLGLKIVSPKSVKKYALKGNASKEEMVLKFLENDIDCSLTKLLKDYPEYYINRNNKISCKKPIDDMVDSYFIMDYFRNI